MNFGQLIALGGLAFIAYLYANKEAFTLEPQGSTTSATPTTTPNQSQPVLNGGGGGNDIAPIYAQDLFGSNSPNLADMAWGFADWVNSIPVGGGYREPQGYPTQGNSWVIDVGGGGSGSFDSARLDNINLGDGGFNPDTGTYSF